MACGVVTEVTSLEVLAQARYHAELGIFSKAIK